MANKNIVRKGRFFLGELESHCLVRQSCGTPLSSLPRERHENIRRTVGTKGFVAFPCGSFSQVLTASSQTGITFVFVTDISNPINPTTWSSRCLTASLSFDSKAAAGHIWSTTDNRIPYMTVLTHQRNFPPVLITKMIVKSIQPRTRAHFLRAGGGSVGCCPTTFWRFAVGATNSRSEVE